MRPVIIESPYKGDVARNKRYLRACIRDCLRRGESPYASHRMLTDALNDDIPEERALGIEAGLAWAHVRQPVFDSNPADGYILRYNLVAHLFYIDLGYSSGMKLAQKRFDDEGVLHEERTLPPDDLFFTEPRHTDPLLHDIARARAAQPPELRTRFCSVCGPFMMSGCPAAPDHDLR